MVWLIVGIAVVLLGIAWFAGQGRLGGMPPLVDDRPGMDLPDTPLTGDDLHGVRFAVTLRGYSMSQVDALLDRLAKQLDAQVYEPVDEYDSWLAQHAPAEIDDAETADETGELEDAPMDGDAPVDEAVVDDAAPADDATTADDAAPADDPAPADEEAGGPAPGLDEASQEETTELPRP